jgi:excisionase family DNA binding protein
MKQLLTRSEAADVLRICTRSLDRQIREGGLPTVRIGGKILIPFDDLMTWTRQLPSVVSTPTITDQ